MATLADISSLLNKLQNSEASEQELQNLQKEIINTLADNKEMFENIKHAGDKAVLRQYLKSDKDFLTADSLNSAIESAVISEKYANLVKANNKFTPNTDVSPITQLLWANSPDSVTMGFSRSLQGMNAEFRKAAEQSLDPVVQKEIVINLDRQIPEHRRAEGTILDCIEYDIWFASQKLKPEEAAKKGLFIYTEETKYGDRSISKLVELRIANEGEDGTVTSSVYLSNQEPAYFTINREKTLAKITNYMQNQLYLVKSLELKGDFSNLTELVNNLFIQPLFGYLQNFAFDVKVIELVDQTKRTLQGKLMERKQNSAASKKANQDGYLDAVLSISDGKTPPTGINEKNMRIDEQTVIDKYFAADKRIYRNTLAESEKYGIPVQAIARTVKVLSNPGVGDFLIVSYKGDDVWVPIAQDFITSTEFADFWRTSHITNETLSHKHGTTGAMTSAITSVDGYHNPANIDLESTKSFK